MGLEALVLDQVFKPEAEGGILELPYINLETRELRIRRRKIKSSHVVVSRGISAERASAIETRLRSRGLVVKTQRIGSWYHVMVGLSNAGQKRLLPEDFVVNRGEKCTPRTILLDQEQLAVAERALQALNYTPLLGATYENAEEKHYKVIQPQRLCSSGMVQLELSPMSPGSFKKLAPAILDSPTLRKLMQIAEYRTERRFKTEQEAETFKRELEAEFNLQPQYHEFAVVPSAVKRGMRKQTRYVVLCYAPALTSIEMRTIALSSRGLTRLQGHSCHKKYLDMAQQDEQRRWREIMYPASHDFEGKPLPREQFSQALDVLLDHVAVVDLETTRWIKGKPAPSGEIVHAVLRSRTEKTLFIHKDYAPLHQEVDGYKIILCEDELDLVLKLEQATQRYAFLGCHNGQDFDWPHLKKFNQRRSDRQVKKRLDMLVRNMEGKDFDFNAWKDDELATQERINSLRKKHKLKARAWTRDRLIDTRAYAAKRHSFAGSASLEALTGFQKDVDYEELEDLFTEKAPEGLLKAAQYTAKDGEKTWQVLLEFLPAMLRESIATGRPLHSISTAEQYHNIKNAKIKRVLESGKHMYPFYTRETLAKLEKEEKAALDWFRNYTKRKPALALAENTSVYYNPLVLESLKHLFSPRHPVHALLTDLDKESLRTRILCFHAAENYFTTILSPIKRVFDKLEANLDVLVDRDSFEETLQELYKGKLPDMRIAAELRLQWSFSLYDQYANLFHTAQELGNPDLLRAGPFIIGELPGYEQYKLGTGNAASLYTWTREKGQRVQHTHLLATLDTGSLVHGVKFRKKDAAAGRELLKAIAELREPWLDTTSSQLNRLAEAMHSAYQMQLNP